jgi:indole-3-glycerol phosphate synthase
MDPARAARVLGQVDRSAVAIHLSGLATPEDVAQIGHARAWSARAQGGDLRLRSRSAPALVGEPPARRPPLTRRADAALIGEALMRQDDPTALLEAMMRAAAVPPDCGS